MTHGRRCERKVVRRLHASFSGSPEVGNGLDGELAQLVPRAGLTSAQTDAVIPPGTTVSSRSRSLKAEFRRHTTFHSDTPPSNNTSVKGGGPGVFPRSPLGAARSAGVNKRHGRRFDVCAPEQTKDPRLSSDNRGSQKRRLPTLPTGRSVPSAMVSLTSLFGMGRGGSSPL